MLALRVAIVLESHNNTQIFDRVEFSESLLDSKHFLETEIQK